MKVLIVDDDVVSRMVLMHLIDSCGKFDIVEAEDGLHAWEQLAQGLRPLAVFCDLRMPRLSGMELLTRIKADPELNDLPFILVSSASDQETVQQATSSGAAGYLVKPFKAEQVRTLLDTMSHQGELGAPQAEAPLATMQRLAINGERLQAYLGGFQAQLTGAGAELDAMIGRGEQGPARLFLERLHAGCVTLGLNGAALAFGALPPGELSCAVVQALLADTLQAVQRQSELAKRQSAMP